MKPIARIWSRLVGPRLRRNVDLIYSPRYRVDFGATPHDPLRAEKILTFLLAERLCRPERQLRRPHRATLKDLRLAHSAAYLRKLRHPEALTEILGTTVWDELHDVALQSQRSAVGGTMLATSRALEKGHFCVNLGGGFHHAGSSFGKGFCIFNDVAVAILQARARGFDMPILVIDLDLHDGNGTREIFAEDPSVFTASIHNQDWDGQPAMASLALELGGDVDDETYLGALEETLPRLVSEVRPGLVYFLAGTDPAADDRIGNWNISSTAMLQRDRFVFDLLAANGADTPAVMVLAGGYGGKTWRYSARFLGWLLSGGRTLEPPSTEEITIARYRHLAKHFGSLREELEENNDTDWSLSEEDLFGGLGGNTKPSKLLGHISHHDLEMALEWTGFLDRLRGLGFPQTYLDLDLEHPSGHTVRLFGDPSRRELLTELRLRIDKRTLVGMELLSIEWLLLQNPRATFAPEKRALPGQKHPGLGLLNDVVALLILLCDQMQLDGISFVPSHFHLAATSRKYLRFADPKDEAWFLRASEILSGLSRAEATREVAGGRIIRTASGEPEPWHPMPMVLPISDRLHDLASGPEYERTVEHELERLRTELAGSEPTDALRDPAGTGSDRASR